MKSLLKKYLPFKIILKVVCKRNQIKKYILKYSDSLKNESIKIEIARRNSDKEMVIEMPKKISINGKNGRRLKNCLQLWIPHIISLQKMRNTSFSINLNASDLGEENVLSMDSVNNKNLIPDEFSMQDYSNRKYDANNMSFEDFKVDWMKRKHSVFWRGSSTGKLIKSIEDLKSLKRVSLCLKYNNSKSIDLKISRIVQSYLSESEVYNWLDSNNIKGSLIAENKFKDYCYYPDIAGNALAWGTIRKYRMGILIFRPEHSRYLLYYNLMKPWVHYIPIKSDYSDLENKFKWAERNINETVEIAYNGYVTSNNYIKNIPIYFKQAITSYLDSRI